VLVLGGRVARTDVPGLCARVRVLLEGGAADQVVCDTGALVAPDIDTVDALARLQLAARRLGCQLRLRHASRELQELFALAGLRDVIPFSSDLGLEPSGQTEEREQGLGVEEEADPADPAG
jgi:ABC-type transporter Mla MlaB component